MSHTQKVAMTCPRSSARGRLSHIYCTKKGEADLNPGVAARNVFCTGSKITGMPAGCISAAQKLVEDMPSVTFKSWMWAPIIIVGAAAVIFFIRFIFKTVSE